MSTTNVFVSSSPPRAARIDSYPVASSSPELPLLTDIFVKNQKRPALRSGSNAVALPANALHTFTSAADLLRDAPGVDVTMEETTRSPPLKPKTVNGLMRRTNADTQVQTSVQKEAPILIESSPKETPGHKPKSKTPTLEDKQPPIQKGRVTKAVDKDKPRKKTNQSRAKAETVSKHFPSKKEEDQPTRKKNQKKEKLVESHEAGLAPNDLEVSVQNTSEPTSCSEPALQRRIDWTPPPADNAVMIALDSDHQELLSSVDRPGASKEVFQQLFDNYACKDESISISPGQQQQPGFLKKRKRIDLVSTISEQAKQAVQVREVSPPKPVTTKKKTRTITEIATAPYALPEVPEPDIDLSKRSTRDSLLEYFDSGGEVKALVEYQSVVMSKTKETAKPTKAKAKAKPRKKKAGAPEAPILLSPNSALKQSSKQDFVFGTSSQLLGDESPTTLRELQLAIQASNRDDDPFGESDSPALWRAGARDQDGELMDVDVIDLVQTPALLNKHRRAVMEHIEQPQPPNQPQSDDFIDIDTIALDTPAPKGPLPSQHNSHFFQTQQAPTPPLSNPTVASVPVSDTVAPRPKYETFTDIQLSKQIASYGFKPIKKRQAMIALLDQCWASKNPGATSAPSQSISTTSASTSSKGKEKAVVPTPPATTADTEKPKPEKRPRGRPKKTPEAAVAGPSKPTAVASKSKKETSPKKPRAKPKQPTRTAEVIADSENSDPEDEEAVLSRSRSRSCSRSSKAAADSDGSDSETAEATAAMAGQQQQSEPLSTLTPTDEQALFRHITQLIKAQPRSHDPANPSWHEKMLLYDPIVLEELASWLNAGPLTEAGWDGEVAPADVKRWCEAKSVVCMWRIAWSGRARKRV